ncbi:MAG TPA: DUF433 domain-containing protein [Thermoanaerobaculia bacterium]|jgi:uncharacterized protein (DUF433 family)|nr:DUF433 domain-containing protein [Thermoanaerobaculia bacterium]
MASTDELLQRITANPEIYGGKPILRGHRMAVEHVVSMLGAGNSVEDLLHAYPWMEREDVQACLLYAARTLRGERVAVAVEAK